MGGNGDNHNCTTINKRKKIKNKFKKFIPHLAQWGGLQEPYTFLMSPDTTQVSSSPISSPAMPLPDSTQNLGLRQPLRGVLTTISQRGVVPFQSLAFYADSLNFILDNHVYFPTITMKSILCPDPTRLTTQNVSTFLAVH